MAQKYLVDFRVKMGYFLATLGCLALYGCPTVIEVPLPTHKPKLVINSLLHPDESLKVFVSHSVGIIDDKGTEGSLVRDAEVKVWENGMPLGSLMFKDTVRFIQQNRRSVPWGFYYLPYFPKEGHTYTVEVSHQDYPSAKATTRIPFSQPIQKHYFSPNHLINELGIPYHLLRITTENFSPSKAFFQVAGNFIYTNSEGMDAQGIFAFSALRQNDVFPRQGGIFFRGKSQQLPRLYFFGFGSRLEPPVPPPFADATFELRVCDSLYYAYQLNFPNQQQAIFGDFQLFPQELEPLPSNVEGGYGILTSYAAVKDTL